MPAWRRNNIVALICIMCMNCASDSITSRSSAVWPASCATDPLRFLSDITLYYCRLMHPEKSTLICAAGKHAPVLSLHRSVNLYRRNGRVAIKSSIWSRSGLWHEAYCGCTFAPFTSFYRQVLYLISTTRLDDTVGNQLGVGWWLFNCSAMHHYDEKQ